MDSEYQGLLNGKEKEDETNGAHIAEKVEQGGETIENTLMKLNVRYQTLFFSSGVMTVFCGAISLLESMRYFYFTNFIVSTFLIVMGLIMMILDIPGTPRWAAKHRIMIRKYIKFLTRLTGKAVWFFFLGAMSCLNLWPHSKKITFFRSFWVILSSSFILAVAVVGFLIALRKSLRLEKLKKTIKLVSKGAYIDCYRKYSVADPDHGMQFEEFNRMCSDHTNGYIFFDFLDLFIIFNALDEHQKCSINEREFLEWINGPVTYL
ncbi:hypothetical protein YYC_02945 [Plasmodium yoelii 17X]|uniref:COPI associated protein n=5 Tax=Plasmodium yoelii TaxID=5861 RepID=A0AAF0B4Q5_PLAYO|nr:conserved protein, unknown function [Plasmodium yoelii]ETB59465.1 hypothetical protein YYC_02945 [Plasmodium yoelii 17X]WBY58141.1 hypothetical protein Py17XNL_001002390 [Plasmodium yoelii yoelii]CDU85185.1 conserved Plasmodium protein, unknown function [Plasmodium yoelii]VTZ79080.1 conserved protein, unknown function [Plasmodium yoelii]|eukprot:XP_022813390.1 conserved protein, unknown function [Plasmodium yoelii]